jgi:hypothetical protein
VSDRQLLGFEQFVELCLRRLRAVPECSKVEYDALDETIRTPVRDEFLFMGWRP